jgi:hypothetical protein
VRNIAYRYSHIIQIGMRGKRGLPCCLEGEAGTRSRTSQKNLLCGNGCFRESERQGMKQHQPQYAIIERCHMRVEGAEVSTYVSVFGSYLYSRPCPRAATIKPYRFLEMIYFVTARVGCPHLDKHGGEG